MAGAAAPLPTPAPTPTTTLPENHPIGHPLFTRIRLATKSDIPHIHKLITSTPSIDSATTALPPSSPYPLPSSPTNPTPFLLSTPSPSSSSNSPPPPPPSSPPTPPHLLFRPSISKSLNFDLPITDPESHLFKSSETDSIVAGFVLFFPNYSTFLGKPGFYIEDLFVRECYRSKGFGKMRREG
ncbi:hypothetical protein ACSBR1_018839 [Camellia fascicularis]